MSYIKAKIMLRSAAEEHHPARNNLAPRFKRMLYSGVFRLRDYIRKKPDV
jgi:hypothetical protein